MLIKNYNRKQKLNIKCCLQSIVNRSVRTKSSKTKISRNSELYGIQFEVRIGPSEDDCINQ